MRTRTIVVVVVVGLVVVGFAFGLANVFRDLRSEAVITITRGGDGRCTADTKPDPLQGHRWKSTTWTIKDTSPPCLPDGAEVELRFSDGSPFFVDNPKDRSEIKRHVKPWAGLKTYTYKVWAVGGGTDYVMEDPQLEIVY